MNLRRDGLIRVMLECRAMVPDGGNRATLWGSLWIMLRWCPQGHMALGAWPYSRYLLEVWADIMGSNEFMLLLGGGHSRPSQGWRLWEQNLGDMCKGHASFYFFPFRKRHLIPDASLLVSWVHISPFLYAKCYLVTVSRGHGFSFK